MICLQEKRRKKTLKSHKLLGTGVKDTQKRLKWKKMLIFVFVRIVLKKESVRSGYTASSQLVARAQSVLLSVCQCLGLLASPLLPPLPRLTGRRVHSCPVSLVTVLVARTVPNGVCVCVCVCTGEGRKAMHSTLSLTHFHQSFSSQLAALLCCLSLSGTSESLWQRRFHLVAANDRQIRGGAQSSIV